MVIDKTSGKACYHLNEKDDDDHLVHQNFELALFWSGLNRIKHDFGIMPIIATNSVNIICIPKDGTY